MSFTPTLALLDGIGRDPDPDTTPRFAGIGLRIVCSPPVWLEGQLLVHFWLTLALAQDRFAEFLDPIESVVVTLEAPAFGWFGALPLRDPTHVPLEPALANHRGPSGWGNPDIVVRSFADFTLDLQLGPPNREALPEGVPEHFCVFVRASLHEQVSNTLELTPGRELVRSFIDGGEHDLARAD